MVCGNIVLRCSPLKRALGGIILKRFLLAALSIVFLTSDSSSCKSRNDPSSPINIAIYQMIEGKSSSYAQRLLKKGMDVNTVNSCGASLLLMASFLGDHELVKTLLSSGALPNIQNYEGNSPVFASANFSNNKILKLLLDNGGDPNLLLTQEYVYNSPLMIAAINENIEGVRLLLEAGADCNYRNQLGNSARKIGEASLNLELKALLMACDNPT
ncbi:ankyrin repeat domain-containing protein [Vibrio parahaemolyticus]|nr:ankyrin repeat domain-containing protein [Vibrio parahaemolyticus]